MLIKLLKYEFYFYFRKLPPFYLALLLVALIARFQGNSTDLSVPFLHFSWRITIVVVTVITLLLIIQRFMDNFMKEPGSLMFTLPVTVWELISSKAIAACCMILTSVIAVFVSAVIINMELKNWLLGFLPGTGVQGVNFGAFILDILVILIMIIQQICLVYMAIIVSHILPRFRFIAGCAIYLAINNFVGRFASDIMNKTSVIFDDMPNTVRTALQTSLSGFTALVLAALYFWAAGLLLKRTFNLE